MKKLLLLLSLAVFVFGASPASASIITVQKGDSMWKIAKRYNVSFAKVLELNKHYIVSYQKLPGGYNHLEELKLYELIVSYQKLPGGYNFSIRAKGG